MPIGAFDPLADSVAKWEHGCHPRRIVIGATHAQTCLTMTGRIRALRDAGFAVTLVCSPGELLHRIAKKEGAEVVEIAMARRMRPIADLVALIKLWHLLHRLKPEMVEFSTPKAGLLGSVAAWFCRVPVRIYLLRGLRLETCHGLKRWLLLKAERMTAACAQVVICNSASLQQAAVKAQVAPVAKLHLLGAGSSNGVDLRRFMPRKVTTGSVGAPVIGYVGRLTRDKGIPVLLEAFARVREAMPSARLLLVGWFDQAEDALAPALRRVIAEDTAIEHTGFVADVAPYYAAMDVFVMPSWREGFPNVVLEAAASGLTVVASESTGCRDAVVHGETGLLVPPGDCAALGDAVLYLLRSPAARARMGSAARAWVVENYADHLVLARTVEFYSRLLGQAQSRGASGQRFWCGGKKASTKEAFEYEQRGL